MRGHAPPIQYVIMSSQRRFGSTLSLCMHVPLPPLPYAVEKLTIRVIHGDNVPLTLLCLLRARQLFETARQEEPAIRFD